MPLDIDIQVDERELKATERMLADYPKVWPKAARRAVNKTGTTIRTRIRRRLAKAVAVTQKAIAPGLQLIRATAQRLSSTVRLTGKRIPLLAFGARQVRSGVTYRIARAGGRKRLLHAFINAMPRTGHRGVFMRGTNKRLPIYERFGPSLPAVYQEAANDIDRQTRLDAAALLSKHLNHEVQWELSKSAGRLSGAGGAT